MVIWFVTEWSEVVCASSKKTEFCSSGWANNPWVHFSLFWSILEFSEEGGFNFACSFWASVLYLFTPKTDFRICLILTASFGIFNASWRKCTGKYFVRPECIAFFRWVLRLNTWRGFFSSISQQWPQWWGGWVGRQHVSWVMGSQGCCGRPVRRTAAWFSPLVSAITACSPAVQFALVAFFPFSSSCCGHPPLNSRPRWQGSPSSRPLHLGSKFSPASSSFAAHWSELSCYHHFLQLSFGSCFNWTSTMCCVTCWDQNVLFSFCMSISYFLPLFLVSTLRVHCLMWILIMGRVNPHRKHHTDICWMIDQLNRSVSRWVNEYKYRYIS